ncbi:MBL fold metallo-hydrolase [Marinomonas rhizomae]|uniref:Beta-lactamase superfamily II metal-dependent hydrolase n=1 Tax=Marinomonas rhizomae TaxID=491948 RepID=A0A366JD21_9GAMM|nr:MBL fold metallo-hydrolase [Marinomonas rhizomae]RBP84310.1 beta-lactamase superfamily II metal-dependent hydrolase [Marinomonas rhizomae]RNF74629.1 MBL fold metallo-hydrolase [Marinomonas rhizomae]
MLKITNIPAKCGDSFLIEDMDDQRKLLLDCGFKLTYLNNIKQLTSSVDYLILTHSDEDHIHGAIPLIEDTPHRFTVGKVFVNVPSSYEVRAESGDISIHQAITLENLLKEKELPYQSLLAGETVKISENISLEIISPSKEDLEYFIGKYNDVRESSTPDPISKAGTIIPLETLANHQDAYKSKKSDFTNVASIAFILKYKDRNLLFLGDAHPTVVTDYLEAKGFSKDKKYTFDYIKLSHHGSITSISNKFVAIVSCSNYILSTNGGKARSLHPSRETLAKLALSVDRNGNDAINFFFNYPVEEITARNGLLISSEEKNKYNIKLIEQSSFDII